MDTGSKSQTTVQNTAPWSEQIPYLQEAFKEAQNLYHTGGPSYYEGPTLAALSDPSQAAIDGMTSRALRGSSVSDGAQALAGDIFDGEYLSAGNPHFGAMLDSMTDATTRRFNESVMPAVASQFSKAGRYGSKAHQNVAGQAVRDLTEKLANTAGELAYKSHDTERNRQMQTMQMASNLAAQDYADLDRLASAGAALDKTNQAEINADIARFNFAQQQPYNNLASFLGMVKGGYGSTGTTTQQVQDSRMDNLLNHGYKLASLYNNWR